MGRSPVVCDVNLLRRIEDTYTRSLLEKPDDMQVRLRLAWCLFMQALHQAGQESVVTALVNDEASHRSSGASLLPFDKDAYLLLKDCLRQTFAIMQLSPCAQDQKDVRQIQELVGLLGAGQVFTDAKDEAYQILSNLTQDILSMPEGFDESDPFHTRSEPAAQASLSERVQERGSNPT